MLIGFMVTCITLGFLHVIYQSVQALGRMLDAILNLLAK